MSWNVGDRAVIRHTPNSLYGREIVIPVTVDVVGTGQNEGMLKVSSEHQTQIIIKASFLSKE